MARLEGTQLGNFELLEHIGTGGMAEVYRACQRNAFGREVAVKVIKPGFAAQPLFRERFLREGQATARLAHPHILPLIELGVAGRRNKRLFLVMPYVRGGTLRDLLARAGGPLSIEVITPLFLQLCKAVQYAHAQGLVHRDIKPSNILLQDERHVLLADFGIALDMEDVRLTSTGMGLGTPEYTAPEQAKGIADKRSDLYSLGIILFELLTGQVPFTGRTPFEVLFQHTAAPVPSLRTAYPTLPEALTRLDRVIQTTLAKEPTQRFQTASALSEAFQMALAQNTEAATTPGQAESTVNPPSPEAWSPPHAFFPLPAAPKESTSSEPDEHGETPPGAEDDPLGERPTSPATLSTGFKEFSDNYAQSERPSPYRSRGPLIAIALLAVLLLGGAAIVFTTSLLGGISSNLLSAPHTSGATSNPHVQNTASPLPTKSPQRRPTATPTPTAPSSPTPISTASPTASPSPTSSPTPTSTPGSTPPSTSPGGSSGHRL